MPDNDPEATSRLIFPGLISPAGETRHPVGSKALPEGAIEDAKTVDLTYAGWMGAWFSSQGPEGPPGEPRAEQHVLARTFHGVSLNDEFGWLKAANWREVMRDPLKLDLAIRAYLQAENDYCERALGETAGLQQTLFAEMKAPHQGGRFNGTRTGWTIRLLRSLS